MRKKIFRNMCLLALVTILLSSSLVTIVYYATSTSRMRSEVREESRFLRGAVELSGEAYLDTVQNTPNRITLIDTDGTVLFDNQADPVSYTHLVAAILPPQVRGMVEGVSLHLAGVAL